MQKGNLPIIIIFLVVLGSFAYFGYKYVKSDKTPKVTNTPAASTSPTSSPSTNKASKLFHIKFELKSKNNVPKVGYELGYKPGEGFERFDDYIESVLKLTPGTISQLSFDYKTTNPYGQMENSQFSQSFYILLNKEVKIEPVMSDSYTSVQVTPTSYSLLPYLVKPDYCEKDTDCNLTSHGCTYGAFNNYRTYIDPPWGCGPGGYKDTYDYVEWGKIDPEMGCAIELEFDGSKCQNSVCTETGVKKVCVAGSP